MQLDLVFTQSIDAVLGNIDKRDFLHRGLLDMTHEAADHAAMGNHDTGLFNCFKTASLYIKINKLS